MEKEDNKQLESFYYLLDDDGRHYVSEGNASYSLVNAKKFTSMEEMVTTTPVMKDWNWDYKLYKKTGENSELIKESLWTSFYGKWKKENKEDWEKIYKAKSTFFRTTTP